jgi:hypothetical protein
MMMVFVVIIGTGWPLVQIALIMYDIKLLFMIYFTIIACWMLYQVTSMLIEYSVKGVSYLWIRFIKKT